VVVERALVEIGIGSRRRASEQLLGQPEHVVSVAGLGALAVAEQAVEVLRIVEVLGHAVAAEGDRALAGDILPEEARAGLGGLVAGERGDALEADDLRDLGVGVLAGELVAVRDERVEHGLVVEAFRSGQVLRIAGDGVEIGQRFVHASVFHAEHPLHLFVVQTGGDRHAPVAQTDEQLASLLISGLEIGVAQTGEGLVHVVPGNPLLVDRGHVSSGDGAPELAAARHATEVAVAEGVLAGLEFGEHAGEARAQLAVGRVLAGGDHVRERGEVVAGGVTVEAAALPVAVGLRLDRQARFAAERRDEPVGIEREQVFAIRGHGGRERAVVEETDGAQRVHLRRSGGVDPVGRIGGSLSRQGAGGRGAKDQAQLVKAGGEQATRGTFHHRGKGCYVGSAA